MHGDAHLFEKVTRTSLPLDYIEVKVGYCAEERENEEQEARILALYQNGSSI